MLRRRYLKFQDHAYLERVAIYLMAVEELRQLIATVQRVIWTSLWKYYVTGGEVKGILRLKGK